MPTKSPRRKPRQSRLGHDPIRQVATDSVRPAPENDELYRPIDANDPEIVALAVSIQANGVREPLVISLDGFIISGHRRHAAATLAGLVTIPCRTENVSRRDEPDRFLMLLREHNRQRIKTLDERAREVALDVNPAVAHEALRSHRAAKSAISVESIKIAWRDRAQISAAKQPFVEAIQRVIEERREYWPLSDRQIHYALLNNPPLRHASKPGSTYANDLPSYKALTELLTRARLEGLVPLAAIADETRPVTLWNVHRESGAFIANEMEQLLKGYWRDLTQSQPNHVEVVVEKNTLRGILKPICERFTIPLTSGRGFCSLAPRWEIAQRYRKSGKQKLIVLFVSDFDPEGQTIASSFALSMQRDFDVQQIVPVKVALTAQQVKEFKLQPLMIAKEGSATRKAFVKAHGESVWEVESIQPAELQRILTEAIESVIDVDAFNAELAAEEADAAHLASYRAAVIESFKGSGQGGAK